MHNYDMWQRMRIYSAINRACFNAKPLYSDFTDMQQAFLEGAATLLPMPGAWSREDVSGSERPF